MVGWPRPRAASVEDHSFHDVNKDGRTDIVTINGKTHSVYINTNDYNNDGTKDDPGFKTALLWTAHDNSAAGGHWVDLNGDGMTDYVTIDATNSDRHYVSFSTGVGYDNPPNYWVATALDAGKVPVFRDMNGDGLTDYVSAATNGNHKLSLSNGRTGYDNVTWVDSTNSIGFGNSDIFDFVDLDGDGKPDFVSTNITTGAQNVAINRCAPMHLMTNITDGLGVETVFDYLPLTDDAVYAKGSSTLLPDEVFIENPNHVVHQMHHSDGIGGNLIAEYSYEGFKFERGRGSLGFAKVTVKDLDRDTTTISEYEQAWPYTGLLKHNEVLLTSISRLLKESDIVYGEYDSADPFDNLKPAANQSIFTAVKSQTDKLYDADDGRHLSTITTTYTDASDADNIDGYGNRARTKVVVIDKEDANKNYITISTSTFDTPDSTNWILSKVNSIVVHKEVDGKTSTTDFDRTTGFTYDSKGRVKTTTRESNDTDDEYLKTTFYYDNDTGAGFGNVVKEEVTGHASAINPITTRDEEVVYDARGRFPVTLTNAEGHQQTQTYYEDLGLLEEVTGVNGQKTTRFYDNFGRLSKEDRPDGTYSEVGYFEIDWVTYPTPTGISDRTEAAVFTQVAEYKDITTPPTLASAPIRLFVDNQGRSLRQRVKGFDGTYVHSDTEYDSQGRLKRSSQPYYVGETVQWSTPAYDGVNRVVGVTAVDTTQNTTTDYNGFDVTVTDNKIHAVTQYKNAIGQLVEVKDAQTNRTTYDYDVGGNLTSVRTHVINATTYDTEVVNVYDRMGRRTSMDDPDTGVITTTYNALSEVVDVVTPELANNLQSATYTYDLLGRLKTRTEPETVGSTVDLKSTWDYDHTASGNLGKGKFFEEKLESDDGTTLTTLFTRKQYHVAADVGRLSYRETNIDGMTTPYQVDWIYDDAGRVSQVIYPNSPSYPTDNPQDPGPDPDPGFTVEYYYNPRGYMEQVYEAGQSATPLYQVTEVDAEGRINEEYLGDESLTGMGYAQGSGRLLYTHASRYNTTTSSIEDIQNLVYQYDTVGNMTARSNLINDLNVLTETFNYDVLDRLDDAQVTNSGGTEPLVDYIYNAMGNLTTKGDVGIYTYPLLPNTDPRPHAVKSILFNDTSTATYDYDDNGNMESGDDRTLTWYSFDKLKIINKSGNTRDFYYGPDRARYKQVHNTITKHYIENSLVTVNDPGGSVETWEMSIFANGQAVAVVVDSTVTKTTKYLHRDHLGSITGITDLTGTTLNVENLSYDAFGKRRDASDWEGAAVGTPSLDRGYTGHEHLDDVDVIHMNGRIYDPTLGRMLSADPIIQAPGNSQNYNRYSYVFNNPLKFTDPSGFTACYSDYACGGGGGGNNSSGISVSFSYSALTFGGSLASRVNGAFGGFRAPQWVVEAYDEGDLWDPELRLEFYNDFFGLWEDDDDYNPQVAPTTYVPPSRSDPGGSTVDPTIDNSDMNAVSPGDQQIMLNTTTPDGTPMNPPGIPRGAGGNPIARSAGSVFTGNSILVAQNANAPLGNLSNAGKLTGSTNAADAQAEKAWIESRLSDGTNLNLNRYANEVGFAVSEHSTTKVPSRKVCVQCNDGLHEGTAFDYSSIPDGAYPAHSHTRRQGNLPGPGDRSGVGTFGRAYVLTPQAAFAVEFGDSGYLVRQIVGDPLSERQIRDLDRTIEEWNKPGGAQCRVVTCR